MEYQKRAQKILISFVSCSKEELCGLDQVDFFDNSELVPTHAVLPIHVVFYDPIVSHARHMCIYNIKSFNRREC